MTQLPPFSKTHHSHTRWAKDFFSDVTVIEGAARTLYLAGIGAEDPDVDDPSRIRIQGVGDFAAQTRIVFEKIAAVLAAHGATMGDIVRMTAYVTDATNIRTYFAIQHEALGDAPPPPHTFLQVAGLAEPDMLVEVEVTAAVPLDRGD